MARPEALIPGNCYFSTLREIAADHPLTPAPQSAPEPATDEDFESVPIEVASFLNDPGCVSLTMTVQSLTPGSRSTAR
jgi:hypothetical protein